MDYIAMGHRVRQYREHRGLTQEGLSAALGMSVALLGTIEQGSRKASMETLLAIANALEVPTDMLLADSLRFQPHQEKALPRDGVARILPLVFEGQDIS